ncbi:hypothetical protein WWE_01104 [Staphylococcus aureus M1244]|nr:hypothetical protein WWE_01104 [Staphylococcus aureus M1244]
MMIKKLKNMDWFDIFIVGILRLFGVIALMLVVISPIYTVASYQNKEVHQGTITDKYNKRQDKEDKFYIVLRKHKRLMKYLKVYLMLCKMHSKKIFILMKQ